MIPHRLRAAFIALGLGAVLCAFPFERPRAEDACRAPEPVCAARSAVFAIVGYLPLGSAVRIAPDLLVTSRHVVADREQVEVYREDGSTALAEVVPTDYPGDLILLRTAALDPGPVLPMAELNPDWFLFSVGADVGNSRVRVYRPGKLLLAPAAEKPLARLHHDAYGQPGNSGGALVDRAGNLIGIVASGGEGRNDAIPAREIARLRAASGPDRAEASGRIGAAYRTCDEAVQARLGRRAPLGDAAATALLEDCVASGNRQLLDLAAQVLGQAGRFDDSARLFEQAIDQDPNALNSRIGLVVTLHLARRYEDELPHLRWLLDVLPEDPQVLRFAIQSGKWGGDTAMAERALGLLETHHPQMAPAARRFYESDVPRPPAR